MKCPVCGAEVRHELGRSQVQYKCGTTVQIKTFKMGSDAIKFDGIVTGACAMKVSIQAIKKSEE